MEISTLIPIIAIVMPFLMIICVQVAKTISRTQQERMRFEVMRAAIERGQPIPAEALRPQTAPEDTDDSWHRPPSPQNDVRTGLICVGVGVGLFLMLGTFSIGGFDGLNGLRWVGAIPGFVGLALLLNGLLTQTKPNAGAPRTGGVTPAEGKPEPRS